MLPLRAQTRQGDLAPVDLQLVRRSSRLASRNPLVDVTYGERAEDAVALSGSGVRFSPGGNDDRRAIVAGGRVFYPSVQTDADFIAMPVARGAETFWSLRSRSAPEELVLRVDLPPGTALRERRAQRGLSSPPGAEVVSGGRRLVGIAAPSAVDADGEKVPLTMAVRGSELRFAVSHRAGDVAYPVLIDPLITEEYHAVGSGDEAGREHGNLLWWTGNASFEDGAATWTAGNGEMGWAPWTPLIHGQRHLSTRRWPGSGDGWIWFDSKRVPVIPGNTYRATHYARPEAGVTPAPFRTEIVFYDGAGAPIGPPRMGPIEIERPAWQWKRSAWVTAAAPYNAVTASLRMAWEARDGQWHNADSATLEDTTNWSEGTGWWREDSVGQPSATSGRFAMPMDAEAPLFGPGLYVGAYKGAFYADNEFAMWAWQAPPGAYIKNFKMWNYIHNFDYTRTIYGLAYTVPRSFSSQWQAYGQDENWVQWGENQYREFDRPQHEQDRNFAIFGMQAMGSGVRGTGAVAYLQDATIALGDVHQPVAGSVSHMSIAPDRWTNATTGRVVVSAQDYGLGIADMWLQAPGVQGPRYGPTYGGCGDRHRPCPAGPTWSLQYTAPGGVLPEGRNDFRATVADAVDNTDDTANWNVLIDRSGPTFGTPSGSLWTRRTQTDDHRNEGLFGPSHSVRFSTTDGTTSPSSTNWRNWRSGSKSIDVRVRDSAGAVVIDSPDPEPQDCLESNCTKARTWTLNTDDLADGSYTIEAEARDQVGNARTTSFPVYVDRDGDVHGAVAFTGEPEDEGSVIVEEYVQTGTQNAREVNDTGRVTQTVVSCTANSAGCAERRTWDEARKVVKVLRGTSPTDPRVIFSDVLQPANDDLGTASQEGSLVSLLALWQRPPMGNGGRYRRYDDDEDARVNGEVTRLRESLWIDTVTELPIQRAFYEDDELTEVQRYSYDLGRRTLAQAGPGFFRPVPVGVTFHTTQLGPPEPDSAPPADQRTSDERLADARAFRAAQGFPSDVLTVTPMMTDTAQHENFELFDAPLTAAERVEMDRRFAVQAARDVVDRFGAPLPSYGGSYMHRATGLLYVGFTTQVASQLEQLKATFPYPERLRGFLANRSLDQLDALHARIDADDTAHALSFDARTVGLDERLNQVVIGTPVVTQAIRDEVAARYGPGARVEVANPTKARKKVVGGVRNTLNWGLGHCTSGFGAHRVAESGRGGTRTRRYHSIVSAGHCVEDHESGDYYAGHGTTVFDALHDPSIGWVEGVAYPKRGGTLDTDAASVRLRLQRLRSALVRLVYDSPTADHSRVRYRKVYGRLDGRGRGDTVCKMGWRTGHTVCGEIMITKDKFEADGEDVTVKPTVKVKFDGKCSISQGDSGGPVYAVKDDGILGGGMAIGAEVTEACGSDMSRGRIGWVTPIGLALPHFRLNLSTANP